MLLAGWRSPRDQESYNKSEMKALLTMYSISKDITPEQLLGCREPFVSKWNMLDYQNDTENEEISSGDDAI
jgi:hypothetical protein